MPLIELTEEAVALLKTEQAQEEFYDLSFNSGGSFGLRVSKRGRKAFFLIYQINNRRKRMTLGLYPLMSFTKAKQKALSLVQQVVEGKDPAAELRTYKRSLTFGQLAERFINEHGTKNYKTSTLQEYRRILKTYLMPIFKDCKAQDISKQDLTTLLKPMVFKNQSPVMAVRIKNALSSIYEFGIKLGVVITNPTTGLDLGEHHPEPKAARILSLTEVKDLWQFLGTQSVQIEGIFKLILLTGQPAGRVLSLCWEHLRIETWLLQHQDNKAFPSEIFLCPEAVKVLQKVRDSLPSEKYVFPSKQTGCQITSIRGIAVNLNKHLRLKSSWTSSDLRRTVESGLRTLKIRPEVIELIMGRKTVFNKISDPNTDYLSETKSALIRWSKTIASPTKEIDPTRQKGEKVVTLFG